MKTFRYFAIALLAAPCALWAATYPGTFAKTQNSGDHLVTYSVNIPKIQRNDVVMLAADGNPMVGFQEDSPAGKFLRHASERGDIRIIKYKDYVIVENGLYAFSSKKSFEEAKRYLQTLSPDQANVLKLNADKSALMVG